MGVMTGHVRISVEMTGKGDAAQKVNETKKAVETIGDESQRTGAKVTTLKERMGALKTSVGPVNLVRETFENLRGNLGLVTLAFGAVTAAFGALVSVLDTPKVDETTDKFFRLSSSISQSTSAIYGLVQSASELNRSLKGIDSEIASIDAETAEHLGRFEEAKRIREDAVKGRMQSMVDQTMAEIRQASENRDKARKALADAQGQQQATDIEVNHLRELIKMRRQDGLSTALQEQQLRSVQFAQAGVIVNLKGAESAYRGNARAVDDLNRKLEAYANRLLSLDEPAADKPDTGDGKKGGGGGKQTDPDRAFDEEVRRQKAALERARRKLEKLKPLPEPGIPLDRQSFGGAGETAGAGLSRGPRERGRGMADDIRDVSAALSESLPGLGDWAGALREIASGWDDVAAANDNAFEVHQLYLSGKATETEYIKAVRDARAAETRGAIMSVGALAMAGAESIKNERLRAGVLATIHLGLGTALMFVPGSQQEAIGHLAGAAILGSVAIFGGGGGKSGGGSRSASRSVARPLSDRTESGAWTVNIFGGWFGTSSPQETAAALHALTRRGGGSGYVPTQRAA